MASTASEESHKTETVSDPMTVEGYRSKGEQTEHVQAKGEQDLQDRPMGRRPRRCYQTLWDRLVTYPAASSSMTRLPWIRDTVTTVQKRRDLLGEKRCEDI